MSGTNDERAARLSRAIVATITGDLAQMNDLFTQDVLASGPNLQTFSREQLTIEISQRINAFSDRKISVAPLDVHGNQACVEWVASGVHAARYETDGASARVFEPTGRRVRLRAVSVAEFDGDQICSLRSYWDDLELTTNLSTAAAD